MASRQNGTVSARKLGLAARHRRRDLLAILIGTAGYALAVGWVVADPETPGGSNPIPYQMGFAARIVAAIGLITGISGLHRVHALWAGGVGTAANVTAFVSLVLFAVGFSAFWVLGWLLFHLAALLFGIAVIGGRVLERGAGWLLVVGSTVGFLGGVIVDRTMFDGEGGWSTFAGTGVVLLGFVWLAASEMRRSAANARRLAER